MQSSDLFVPYEAEGFFRATYTLPKSISGGIREIARHLGVTQSAVVLLLLREAVPDVVSTMHKIPEHPSSDAVIRMRGESVQLIQDRFDAVLAEMDILK